MSDFRWDVLANLLYPRSSNWKVEHSPSPYEDGECNCRNLDQLNYQAVEITKDFTLRTKYISKIKLCSNTFPKLHGS